MLGPGQYGQPGVLDPNGPFSPQSHDQVAPRSYLFVSEAVIDPGASDVAGTVAVTLDPFVSAASGTVTPPSFTGTVAVTLDVFTPVASGAFTSGITGSVAQTLAAFTSAASGTQGETGTSGQTLAVFTPAASGTVTPPAVTGTVAQTLGSFVAAQPATTPWPNSFDTTTKRVIDQFGNPFPLKTMSSWGMAMRATNSEITTYLEGLHTQGFNCVNVSGCGGVEVQSDWTAVKYKNKAGNNFFSGTAWASSFSTGMASTDWIQSECERLGMVLMFSFFISYGTSGSAAEMTAATNANLRTVGQNLGSRYANAPNIVWEVEGDTAWNAGDAIGRRLDYLFRGITETRTGKPNLMFAEPYLGGNGKGMFIDQEGTDPTGYQWLHLTTDALYLYGSSTPSGNNSVEDIDSQMGAGTNRGLWDSEPPYAGATDKYTGDFKQQVRERNYAIFIRGGSGINYGDEEFWPFDLSGFFDRGLTPTQVLTDVYTNQAGYAWAIVDRYVKDPTWSTSTSLVTTGLGSGDTKAAVGMSNHAAVAYFPDNRTVTVDTTVISGTANVRLRWYDPTAGTYSTIAASEAQQTGRSVTLPAARGDGTRDFVLVVDDWVEGTVAVTLGSFTPAASGTSAGPSFTGTVAQTLGVFTPAAAGKVGQVGSSSSTLGSFTSSATGTFTPPPVTGTVAQTLGVFTPAASGSVVANIGSAAVTLAAFTPAASGTVTPPGSGFASPTLAPFTSAASGTFTPPPITGSSAQTLAAFTPAASGTSTPPSFTGTVARTLAPFVPAATGTTTPPSSGGTGSPQLAPFTALAAGTFTPQAITGTAGITLDLFVSGTGNFIGAATTTLVSANATTALVGAAATSTLIMEP